VGTTLPHRRLALGLAVIAPLTIVAAVGVALDAYRSHAESVSTRNAGRVLNAQVSRDGDDAAGRIDRMLAARDPAVLVIGPSYANTNVDEARLADRLGVPVDDVMLLSVPNSVGSHWYAMLKYRVFGAGYRPRLVVVVSGLQSMLLATPLAEASFVNLRTQLPPDGDPLIRAKVRGSALLWLSRFREHRGRLRDRALAWVRDGSARAVLGRSPQQTRAALDKVFDEARVDMTLHETPTERVYPLSLLPAPADGFMGEVTALAASNGAGVVWVRPPMSPHIPAHVDDVVPAGMQLAAAALVEANGGRYVDLRGLPMTSAMFRNEDHMNVDGSRRFTDALGRVLLDVDALTPTSRPGSLPPLQFTREGSADTLQPGEAIVFSAEAWSAARGTLRVTLLADASGAVAPGDVQLFVGDQEVAVQIGAVSGGMTALRTREEVLPPDGPFPVRIGLSPGAPPTRVVALALGPDRGRAYLVGDPDALAGSTVDLLGSRRLADGTLVDTSVRPTFPVPPGPVPGGARPLTNLPGGLAAFDTARWHFLSDDALSVHSPWGGRCSPLRITEDGAALQGANVSCHDVQRLGEGRSCHTNDRLIFSASDGTDPIQNGRAYRMVLEDSRRCDGGVWLFPGDRFVLVFPPDRLAEAAQGARYFHVKARYLQHRAAQIRVTLTVDGQVRVAEVLESRDLKATGGRAWLLDPPVPPDAQRVEVTVENLDLTFYLFSQIALSERDPGAADLL